MGWLGLVWDLVAKPSVLREESHKVPSDTFHLISSHLVPRSSECHELVTKHQHQNRLKKYIISKINDLEPDKINCMRNVDAALNPDGEICT
jgi:hypothetical protein